MSGDHKKSGDGHIRPIAHLKGQKPPAPPWFDCALSHPSEEGSVDVDGAAIRYSAWGEIGLPGLLFVHGGRAHRNWFRPFAPFFADRFRVASLDMSGAGDSGWRPRYTMDLIIDEMFGVIDAAKLNVAGRAIVIGHSFGGWATLSAVERDGERLGGAVVIDSPITEPDPDEGYTIIKARPEEPGKVRTNRIYDTIEEPISRFRLLPNQPCEEHYILDYIAREGLKSVPKEGGTGWTWKFDPARGENFDIHFNRDLFIAARCPLAYVYGAESAFGQGDGVKHLREQAHGRSPFVLMPDAHHHLMLDQPIAFISTLRTLLSCWPIKVGN